MQFKHSVMLPLFVSVCFAVVAHGFVRNKTTHIVLAVFSPLLLLTQICFLHFFYDENTTISIQYAIPISFLTSYTYLYFCIAICILWFFANIYSVFYVSKNYGTKKLSKFMPFYNMAVCSALLMALSSNMVTTFIFYEILTLSTLPLVGFSGDEKSKSGLKKYMITLSLCAVVFLLPGILIIQNTIGTTEFMPNVGTISSMFTQEISDQNLDNYIYVPSSKIMMFAFLLLIFGMAKNTIFPFNGWLPAAMCAPAPVSALLHAVAVVKSGAFLTYKVIYELYGSQYIEHLHGTYPAIFSAIISVATIGIIYASISALFTRDIKRVLAYSTISGIAYILLLFFMATETSMKAGFIQMAFHGITKIGLFFLAGILYSMYHTNDYTKMAGAFTKHKVLLCAIVLFSVSMMGMPLTAGFISKQFTLHALIESQSYIALFGILFSAAMTTIYLGTPMVYILSPVKSHVIDNNIRNIMRYVIIPMIILNVSYFILILFFI